MAAEGKNKVASSLLDLQPTALLELFRFYPDRIDKPSMFLGFHGGSIFDKSIVWQGVEYLPLAIESEGFDILADGKLARPKIRIANKNNLITNMLQNYKDFINAKVVRKRVLVKFLDDTNFDGGNPFGVADSNAELSEETWNMGRKSQESKVFVEFELNSPLDLENFSVNNRSVVAKFCYWQYRGMGCRYQGLPIERADGSPFLDEDGSGVAPAYRAPENSAIGFEYNVDSKWGGTKNYIKGDIAFVESPSVFLHPFGDGDTSAQDGEALRTVYVCVKDNIAQSPEDNPSYWQKDGCTKKFAACQKRFNDAATVTFLQGSAIGRSFNTIRMSGVKSDDNGIPTNTGLFHTKDDTITGTLTGSFTLVGWASMNSNSPYGAGIFSTSERADGVWPNCRFLNINANVAPHPLAPLGAGEALDVVSANYVGYKLDSTRNDIEDNSFNNVFLNSQRNVRAGDDAEWVQYVITNNTGVPQFANEGDSNIRFLVNNQSVSIPEEAGETLLNSLGNFASIDEREAMTWDKNGVRALPQTFMLGAVEHYWGISGYQNDGVAYTTSMNGFLGPWILWNRVLTAEEIKYLRKEIIAPYEVTNSIDYAPRSYNDCTGRMSTLTGGTGYGLNEDIAPILYGQDSLVAWWDGSTGLSGAHLSMMDIHTGAFHLTGSGIFDGRSQSYQDATVVTVDNPTPPYPRFGGFPGTDGFSYGRNTTY